MGGGISFDGGGVRKLLDGGEPPHAPLPLWETLTLSSKSSSPLPPCPPPTIHGNRSGKGDEDFVLEKVRLTYYIEFFLEIAHDAAA